MKSFDVLSSVRRVAVALVFVLPLAGLAADVSPSGLTDGTDNIAIQAAIDAVGSSGKVTLADGTYSLTAPIVIANAIELAGNDADRTKVVLDGAGAYSLLEMSHTDALVHGLTFANGYSDKVDGKATNYAHGPVNVYGGTISNCVCHGGSGKCAGGITLNAESGKTAVVKDSLVYACKATWLNDPVGLGICLVGDGNTLADGCTVTNCFEGHGHSAVCVGSANARLVNSTIADCPKGGVFVRDYANGFVSNCVIRGCTKSSSSSGAYRDGAGIYNNYGRVYDCLVVGNSASGSGGGIYNKATVVGCTVVGNTATVSGPGIYQEKGVLKDCIVWYNGSAASLAQDQSLQLAGGTCTYTCSTLAGNGTGNITDKEPAFVNLAGGDYHLTAASPCRNAASDGTDMGVLPYVAPANPQVSFSFAIIDGVAPAATTFTAAVDGATATGYVWDFGDGATPTVTMDATTNHTFAAAGQYTVTLTVKTAGGDLTYSVPKAVTLASDTAYVSKSGSNTFPYADWNTAATDIRTALAAVVCSDAKPGKVYLADDTYAITEPVEIDKAVELIGNDADRTKVVLDGAGTYGLVEVKHDKALVHGITFANGYSAKSDDNGSHGPVNIHCGTVSNCIHHAGDGKYAGGVTLNADSGKTAAVKDTLIYDCKSTYSNSAKGGGLRFGGSGNSLADGCVISNCTDYAAWAVLVNSSAARMLNCTVVNGAKGGIGIEADGLVSNCVVRGCSRSDSGGGIYNNSGRVYDCLVVGNSSVVSGGGIYNKSTVVGCTVVGNTATVSGPGIYQEKGILKDCIVWYNGLSTSLSQDRSLQLAGGTCTYTCSALAGNGTGNITDKEPAFADLAGGDYHLTPASPCRGTASDDTDMGAFPYDSTTPCASFSFTIADGAAPASATFTAAVDGATATSYVWDFGDGSDPESTTETTKSHTFVAAGQFTVTLTVKTAGGDLTYSVPKAVTLASNTAYVSKSGSNTFPYADWDTAAREVGTAVGAVLCTDEKPGKVYIADGTYALTEPVVLDKAVELIGNDADRTAVVLDGDEKYRLAEVKHEKAFVHGLTFSKGRSDMSDDNSSHGPVNIHCGTVSNCVFHSGYGTYAGGVTLNADSGKTAAVKDSFIYDSKSFSNGSVGGGLRFHGSGTCLARGCVISNCNESGSYAVRLNTSTARMIDCMVLNSTKGGISVDNASAIVSNCVVRRCSYGNGASGIKSVGWICNSTVVSNSNCSSSTCAGIHATGGTVRNCLVTGNTSANGPSGIRANGSVTVESCTVADNVGKTSAGIVSDTASATWRNTLSWGNEDANGVRNPDVVSVGTFDHCLLGVDPLFRRPSEGNYRVKGGSPARNAGVKSAWMVGATDLQGHPRILGGKPDIGCYEDGAVGFRLIVR